MKRAVFLDRDGTIIPETGAKTADPAVEPLPEAIRAIRKLRAARFLIVVATNQAAIARGNFTEADLAVAHKSLFGKFADAGAAVDAVYYCPHLPEGAVPEYSIVCECRKPKPGLFIKAAGEMEIDLAMSYMVGDAERDIIAAQAAGCKAAVRISDNAAVETGADFVARDVEAAADWIISREKRDG